MSLNSAFRTVSCPSCRAKVGDPCRTMTGHRVGRSVSYLHVARFWRWKAQQ